MIKTVIFDLDDTLLWDKKSVKQAFVQTCNLAADKYGIDPNELEDSVREEAKNLYSSYETYPFTQMIGINPFEGLWASFLDEGEEFRKLSEIAPSYRKEAWTKGLSAIGIEEKEFAHYLAEQFPIERKKHPFIYEDTFEVLDKLKDNYTLVMLTNGSPSLQNTKLEITPELVPYFDHIIISGDFGRGKPDRSIFDFALEKANCTEKEAIMVGDNLMTDILGSNRVGMRNIWINREDKERNEVIPSFEVDQLSKIVPIIEELNSN